MKDEGRYAELRAEMRAANDAQLLADLMRFIESFGDHDPDCPGAPPRHGVSGPELVHGREPELAVCVCGYARRFDLLDEVRHRLARKI